MHTRGACLGVVTAAGRREALPAAVQPAQLRSGCACVMTVQAFLGSHALSLRAADLQGMLLFGPPGTGKTLIARQIGKMLNGKEPKVGVSVPLHQAAVHLQCVLPLSPPLNIPRR